MNDCTRLNALVPLFTGEELDSADAARVAAHLAGCPRCREQEADFRRLRDMARSVKRVDERGLPDAARRQIAREAVQRLASRPWLWPWRPALAAMDVLNRPALTAVAAAAILVALLAAPHAFNKSGSPAATDRVMRIDVVAEAGQVRLAWRDGDKQAYVVVKSPDPRTFSPREAYRVNGNVWIDRKPDSWPVVFYRIE